MAHEGYTLVNMKLDPKQREAMPESAVMDRPLYPWGLEVRLDEEAIDKLGLGALPDVGSSKLLHARVEVTGVQDQRRMSGKDGKPERDRSVTLQITDLALTKDDTKSPDAGQALYGD